MVHLRVCVQPWFLTVVCRLERLLVKAKSVLDYFGPYLGRIEIMGSANRIERVYFEIKQSHIDQWEKPQIKVRMLGVRGESDYGVNSPLGVNCTGSMQTPC